MYILKLQVVRSDKSLLKMASQVDMVLAKYNQQYKNDFFEPFKRSDSINAVGILEKGIYVMEIIDKITYSLDDLDIVFGVGFVEMNDDGSYNIDKGLKQASNALQKLHRDNDYGNAHIEVNLGRKNSFEKLINESLRLCDFIGSRWRSSQKQLVSYLVLNYGYMDTFVQKEIADVLNMSPQNFNQQLKNSGYYNIIRMKRELTVVLEQFRLSINQQKMR